MHKQCDRKFSTSKSLQHHLEKHQKEDNQDDQTNASTTTKKKRDTGKLSKPQKTTNKTLKRHQR